MIVDLSLQYFVRNLSEPNHLIDISPISQPIGQKSIILTTVIHMELHNREVVDLILKTFS